MGQPKKKDVLTRQQQQCRSSSSMLSWTLVLLMAVVCTLQLVLLGGASVSSLLVNSTPMDTTVQHNQKWAYVFLLADCDPTVSQPSYRGMLYNILAATYVLKYSGDDDDNTDHQSTNSRADVVVLVQMAATTTATRLNAKEERLLQKLSIQIEYLERPSKVPTFYDLVMAKFHILQMVEYSKILFLDSDVLPLCNLDYLFELSTSQQLGDTVLHAMYEDPVNAGVFLVTPRRRPLETRYWNETMTQWKTFLSTPLEQRPQVEYQLWNGQSGAGWGFYCGDSDQGFLLYWSLFLQRESVSMIVGSNLFHYDDSQGEMKEIPSQQRVPSRTLSSHLLADYSCLPKNKISTWAQNSNPQASQLPFYQDFFHMVGYSKAWESTPSHNWNSTHKSELESSREYWYWVLQRVADGWDTTHAVIPHELDRLPELLGKPKLRGDLLFTRPNPP